MHAWDTYDYGARGYYPAIGRFTSVDPLAEKYYSISPYAYCAGNPVNAIDLKGDSVTFTAESNDQIKTTQNLINNGIGLSVANIDNKGILSVGDLSEDQLSNLTDEQKNFYLEMKGVASAKDMVSIGIVDNSEKVFVGSYETGQIDIADINAFGTGEVANKFSTFGHEIAEQKYKQTTDAPCSP